MYKASDSESPSLDSVPLPPPDADDDLRRVTEFGIVPRGNGGHYLLAALSEAHDAPLDYKLHTYSSERKTWSSITLLNPCTEVKRIIPEKVITIGEGVLGWVDFSCGLLVCNLNEGPPNANFIPLPLPLPGNKDKLRASLTSGRSPRLFRDIACVDGVLKFIEVEHRVIDIMPEKSSDPSDKGLLYDSDLIMSLKRKDMDEKPKRQHSGYRWRAVTWSRMILSNCWHKERTIDVSDILSIEFSDILAAESTYSSVLSGLGVKFLEEWKLYSAFPTFSMDGDDSFYLKSTVEPNDHDGWVVAVDLENKRARLFGAWSFAKPKRGYFLQAFRSCTLSNHLKMTPGIKASAYRNITQAGSCADDPNKTPMCVNAISCKWRSKFQRSSAKEVNRARNEAPIVAQNIRVSGAVLNPVEDRRVIQAREIRRILSEEIFNHAENENRRMAQNHNFSCVPPGRNILPPQQSISNWNWPHNNEYQPVLQQPLSSQQQQMPNQLWNP